jgi:hypothetical protein
MAQIDAPEAVALRLGRDDRATAWVVFAAALLATLGTLNIIDGIAAVSNSQFFVRGAHYIVGDLGAWGWALLAIGICQGLTGLAVARRSQTARWAGVGFASANALEQMLVMPSYSLWALCMFSLDLLVIYGLVVYGGVRVRPA